MSIREGTTADVEGLVRVHIAAFPGFFLTMLGARFLRVLYTGFVTSPAVLTLVSERDGGIDGFGVLVRRPEGFFRTLLVRRGPAFALAAIPALARHPQRVATRLLAAVRYRGDSPRHVRDAWLLSSIGVSPTCGRAGVGSSLVLRLLAEAAAGQARYVYLYTDADANEDVLRFYAKLGFRVAERLERKDGRRMALLLREVP